MYTIIVSDVRFIDKTVRAVGEEIRDVTNGLVASSGRSVEEELCWASGGCLKCKFTVHHDDAVVGDR